MDLEREAGIGEVPAANRSGRHQGSERFDVAALRGSHPLETVVAASGVELTRRGQGDCHPFSEANDFLTSHQLKPVTWNLPAAL